MDNWNVVSKKLARVGYETMFDANWNDLAENSIERILWQKIALNMLSELWRLFKEATNDSK